MAKTHKKPAVAPKMPSRSRKIGLDSWVCLFLFLATLAVYSQVGSYGFVNFDDPEYVTGNPMVRAGLNSTSAAWAFTTNRDGNWFPLTWLSHMLDCQLFGLQGGLHHLTNVLLHALSTLLLFGLLKRMTGMRWRSAFVAFLFALHPLHVESVAWITERKDVLSGLFSFLAIWGYLYYVERPKPVRYLFVLVPFCLGLMSKPMIITLPFVLLLLDVWPLRRISLAASAATGESQPQIKPSRNAKSALGSVLLEKAPLLALSVVS